MTDIIFPRNEVRPLLARAVFKKDEVLFHFPSAPARKNAAMVLWGRLPAEEKDSKDFKDIRDQKKNPGFLHDSTAIMPVGILTYAGG